MATGKETRFGCEVGNTNGVFCQNQLCLQRALVPCLLRRLRSSRCCRQVLQTRSTRWVKSM